VPVSADWALQMEFSGAGLGWTDVTGDVRSEMGVVASWGIKGVTASDRLASTGTLTFTMNNGPTNSGHKIGYYSPDNSNVRTGFRVGMRVRLVLTYYAQYVRAVLAERALYFWRLGDLTGTTAVDLGPSAANGTYVATVTLAQTGHLADNSKSVAWNGTTGAGKVTIAPVASGTTCSVEFWMKVAGSSVDGFEVILSDVGATHYVGFFASGAHANHLTVGFGGVDHFNTTALTVGTIYHVAIAITGGAGTFYINGVADGSFTGFTTATWTNIGKGTSANETFNGTLSNVALYGYALSVQQAKAHYALRTATDVGVPTPIYRFLGTLDSIYPTAGVRGRYLSACTVVDWMDEAARYHVTGLGLQLAKRGDQVFQTVVSSMPIQPAAIQTTPGLDTYPYALDNVQDENTTAMQILQALALSELGYIYVKSDAVQGGTLVYESRSVRGANNVAVQTFGNSMEHLTVQRSRQNLLNKVQVTAHPRKVDAAATTALFQLDTVSATQPFTTLSLNAPFRDPNQPLARVGGTNMQAPVATTDYTMNTQADGLGADITALFTVTISSSSANSATLAITNNSQFTGYITFLQLRGQGVYDYNTTVLSASDTSSQLNFGQRITNLDMPYQADPIVANEAAQYVLNVWSNPLSYVTELSILGNWTDALMQATLLRDISDCVTVAESVTGVPASIRYFINAVELRIAQGRVFRTKFTLAPADQNAYWLLEVVGAGELGLTTRLGYGVIVGHVDVAHADSHGDSVHGDVTHTDTHGDVAHGDTAHSDSTHTDTAHSDVTHSDTAHADTSHSDVAHSDTAFSDSHGDVAHSDTAHSDAAHADSHSDSAHNDTAHSDVAHNDSHSDVAHADTHSDFTDHGDQAEPFFIDINSHADEHNDTAFTDAHNDTSHSDVAHADDAHGDSHSDVNHGDIAHIDAAHSDSHTDTPHSDVTHTDIGHSDAVHSDVAHVDVAHGDAAHGDAAHIDGPAHTDTHSDVSHVDVAHSDTHGDTAHGDLN
jgi:hypothetical protein